MTTTRSAKGGLLIIVACGAALCVGVWLVRTAYHRARKEAVLMYSRVSAPETGYRFPPLSEVLRMTARIRMPDGAGNLIEFEVPERCWGDILESLSPSQYDPRPGGWMGLGEIKMELRSGEKCEVQLYVVSPHADFPDVPLIGAFSAGPDPNSLIGYRGGYTQSLVVALRQALSESQGGGER